MFNRNVGSADRAIRAIVGVVLLGLYIGGIATGFWAWVALIVGIVMLATAILGWCPPYNLLGINTCNVKKT